MALLLLRACLPSTERLVRKLRPKWRDSTAAECTGRVGSRSSPLSSGELGSAHAGFILPFSTSSSKRSSQSWIRVNTCLKDLFKGLSISDWDSEIHSCSTDSIPAPQHSYSLHDNRNADT